MPAAPPPRRSWTALLEATAVGAVCALALSLRLWNLQFGLPDWYHPDEPLKAREARNIAAGGLNPGYFYHPSFMLYAAAAALRAKHEIAATPLVELEAVRVGRLVVALLGTGTVLLTWGLGRAVGGRAVGLFAGALLAVAPLHVVCSHYLKEDVPMTFWAVAAVLGALRIVARGRRRDYVVAGLLAGLTAGTKYVGVLFVGLPSLAHRQRTDLQGGASRAWAVPGPVRLALAGAALGFLLTTPYAVLDWWHFGRGVGHEGGNVFTGLAGIAVPPLPYLWTFHLRYSVLPGLGLLPTLLALGGFVLALRQPEPWARLLTTIVFVLYTVIENSPYKPPPNFDRYAVPLLPFLAVLAAQAARVASARLVAAGAWGHAATALLVAATLGLPLTKSVRLDRAMAPDTRQAARAWLVAHACGRGRILLEGALNVRGTLVPSYVPELPSGCDATYAYSLARRAAEADGYDFVVASSFMYGRFLELANAPGDIRAFYERLFAGRPLLAEIAPSGAESYGFHNPTIRVYGRGRTG